MRWVTIAFLAGLAGCGVSDNLAAFVGVAANAGSIATFHRSPPDLVYSLVTGRNCSVVRLDRGQSYCTPVEPPPEPQAFCTRSLGVVDCWRDPAGLANRYEGVAQAPALTAEQEANRTSSWP